MNKKNIDYSIYFVTDRDLMSTETLEDAVSLAIKGGATIVQLREKNASSRDFYETALSLKKICSKNNVPLIINDRLDIALAVDCDGVHIGQSDLPADVVRKIIGKDKIVGVSASNLEKALEAQKNGADYIGVGAMFSTNTKTNTNSVTIEQLSEIKKAVDIPVVAIGGIKKDKLELFKGSNIDGIAVVSAIISQPDIEKATSELKKTWGNVNV